MKKKERQLTIIVISLIIILIIGILFMFFYQKIRYSNIYFTYNGFDIQKVLDNNVPSYKIKFYFQNNPNPFIISFRNNPKDLENITIDNNIRDILLKKGVKELYITMPSNASSLSVIAATEISKIVGNQYFFNLPTHGALTSPVEGKDVPVKTCNDVLTNMSIILFKIGSESKIYSQNGCVILEGNNEYELIRDANRLVLTLLNIMKP
ncbi:MAG: hypothetical protein NT139_02215 [Candidatus Woesearchaeota archaeon]|nr:hypothetical protein [Candidatus Woesearchaeota archaeon]